MSKACIKVVSGGQTGVDRAALDAAMTLDIDVGGWCPRGRRALDGIIPDSYPLTETRGKGYQTRTRWNVRDSDGTLIICHGEPSGGTALTVRYCETLSKPCFIQQLPDHTSTHQSHLIDERLLPWLARHHIRTLNIAGPREAKACPIYKASLALLMDLLPQCQPVSLHGPLFRSASGDHDKL